MDISTLIYYLTHLIKDGHEWQYRNVNGKGEKPKLYFSFLQFVAIGISLYFIVDKPLGLSSTTKENILGCLSIMVALFMGLLVVLYDKSKPIISEEQDRAKKLHAWNFFYQFNALTSYAILLSVCIIILIVVGLIFDVQWNLFDYCFLPPSEWTTTSIFLFAKCAGIICMRFAIIYFLIDFFIICLYAICSIYQFMYLHYKKDEPQVEVYNEKEIDVTYKEENGFSILRIKIPLIIIFVVFLLFTIYKLIKGFII